jgi:hypothetical protein
MDPQGAAVLGGAGSSVGGPLLTWSILMHSLLHDICASAIGATAALHPGGAHRLTAEAGAVLPAQGMQCGGWQP